MATGDTSDIGIIPTAELGVWAERNDLAPVPVGFRATDHPFQWSGVLPEYREHTIEWGGQARALPLTGDGFLLVYRADRLSDPKFVAAFRERTGREPAVPSSWEDFAVLATQYAAFTNKPSLPAMTGPETAELFFRVAACYDRLGTNETGVKAGAGIAAASFAHDAGTGDTRLNSPTFVAAAEWLGSLPKAAPGTADPAVALSKGDALIGVLSLAQLAKLSKEHGRMPAHFGIAALPGTKKYFDQEKKAFVAGVSNYVPYFGGGKLGVVRTRCPNPDAAFDLLAELGGPTRSLELLSTPGLGVGPSRNAHLEQDRLAAWFGYGFDADRSRLLQEIMRQYVRPEVRNPVYGLRGPDQQALNAAAAEELPKITSGEVKPDAGLNLLMGAWNRVDEKTPKDTRVRWRKLSGGLNQ